MAQQTTNNRRRGSVAVNLLGHRQEDHYKQLNIEVEDTGVGMKS